MGRIPVREECMDILQKQNVPENIIKHCLKVAEMSMDIARKLEDEKGIAVNRSLLRAAAMLHDITKSKPGDHVLSGTKFLKNHGFNAVSEIVRTHGLYHLPEIRPDTIEQKILFYADKRVIDDRIVSLDERFRYFQDRHPDTDKDTWKMQLNYCREIEKELGL